jgi:sulfate adenylyltransferase
VQVKDKDVIFTDTSGAECRCHRCHRQGFTVLFTGLPGAGKSTIARALMALLIETGGREAVLIDGDAIRSQFSPELGFSREHRDINVFRAGHAASEITRQGGIALCALIAPYAAARKAVRRMIEPLGGFAEVHVATALEICEWRDPKGLYKLARKGKIANFTGISDPYEVPEAPELTIDTAGVTPQEAANRVLLVLRNMGLAP